MKQRGSPVCKSDSAISDHQLLHELSDVLLHSIWITVLLLVGSPRCADGGVLEFISPNSENLGHFGYAVSGIPDTNGDGCGDVLVGAKDEGMAGSAYIVDGSNGVVLQPLFPPNGAPGGQFGAAVSPIPDVDGDGLGDVVVGENRGAYIFSSSNGEMLRHLSSPGGGHGFGLR